jgi:hypothetical protein
MPDDFSADRLFSEYKVDEMADDDPRAAEFMAKLKDLMDKAPARDDLDGVEVKLPGFVVPVEADAKETTRFLLVPYYGACIHVPPPPANQTVYVITEAGKGTRPELFDVVWVTGTMSVKRIENDVAEAGYTLYASRAEGRRHVVGPGQWSQRGPAVGADGFARQRNDPGVGQSAAHRTGLR